MEAVPVYPLGAYAINLNLRVEEVVLNPKGVSETILTERRVSIRAASKLLVVLEISASKTILTERRVSIRASKNLLVVLDVYEKILQGKGMENMKDVRSAIYVYVSYRSSLVSSFFR